MFRADGIVPVLCNHIGRNALGCGVLATLRNETMPHMRLVKLQPADDRSDSMTASICRLDESYFQAILASPLKDWALGRSEDAPSGPFRRDE